MLSEGAPLDQVSNITWDKQAVHNWHTQTQGSWNAMFRNVSIYCHIKCAAIFTFCGCILYIYILLLISDLSTRKPSYTYGDLSAKAETLSPSRSNPWSTLCIMNNIHATELVASCWYPYTASWLLCLCIDETRESMYSDIERKEEGTVRGGGGSPSSRNWTKYLN